MKKWICVMVVLMLGAVAMAGPVTQFGVTGYGLTPSAAIQTPVSLFGQYNYTEGDELYTLGIAGDNLELSWNKENGGENFVSTKLAVDLAAITPEFGLPLKLAVGATDVEWNKYLDQNLFAVLTFDTEVLGLFVEASVGTGTNAWAHTFAGVKLGTEELAIWGEKVNVFEGEENWGLEYCPALYPDLTIAFSKIDQADVYSAALNIAF